MSKSEYYGIPDFGPALETLERETMKTCTSLYKLSTELQEKIDKMFESEVEMSETARAYWYSWSEAINELHSILAMNDLCK